MKRQIVFPLVLVLGVALAADQNGVSGPPLWGPANRIAPAARARIRANLTKHALPGDAIHRWTTLALDANALDHTPVEPGEARVFGEQVGPGRTARAFAIASIAIFEAANAIDTKYRSYTGLARAEQGTSIDAAVATAAHDALRVLYPSQAATFDAALNDDLRRLPGSAPVERGVDLGHRAAASILTMRAGDHSSFTELSLGMGFTPGNQPGQWRMDPISMNMVALGVHWGDVNMFVLPSAETFPQIPPPALTSAEYAEAFDEVKRLGGDGITTPTLRTADQTEAGIFWGYDGTPGLGTPPRLYNQIVLQIADEHRTTGVHLARLLALVNTALADASIACWHQKYVYQFWRPVTGIREADAGTGPTGLGDGNPATSGDATFSPLGAPASNLTGPNFTPPFPSYASGHAAFGGTLFEMLRDVYGTDAIAFTFVSDEFNGLTLDHTGVVRPYRPRSFSSLSEAEEENGQSRIYLGIHWAFDKTTGISDGNQIADYVFGHAFQALK